MAETALPAHKVTLESGDEFVITGNRVLIETISDSDTYGDTGIIKPDQYKRYAKSGIVRQVGAEVSDGSAFVGNKVWFEAYSGADMEIAGKQYKIVMPDSLLCMEIADA